MIFLVFSFIFVSVFIGCRNSSPAAPASTSTATPTSTITQTSTPDWTFTHTPTLTQTLTFTITPTRTSTPDCFNEAGTISGNSSASSSENMIFAKRVWLNSGEIKYIAITTGSNATTGTFQAEAAIYSDNAGGTEPENLLAVSSVITTQPNSKCYIPISYTVPGSNYYWIAYRGNNAIGTIGLRIDSTSDGDSFTGLSAELPMPAVFDVNGTLDCVQAVAAWNCSY